MVMSDDDPYKRPDTVDDVTVHAVGRLTEALETVERARGALYDFHQLIGSADSKLDDAIELLRKAGHGEMADMVDRDLRGRNVLEGRWTFQIVDEFDDTYWAFFRHVEHNVRVRLVDGRRHIYEAEMKEERRTDGHRNHTSRPGT